jgi:hypothetical protein
VNELPVHNFIFQPSHWHCPKIYYVLEPASVSLSQWSLPPARDQRWPTAPLFVANISPSLGEFTAPLRQILPIHNITINSNNLFVNFHFCDEKSWRNAPRIWRDFGSALPFQTHVTQTKPVLPLSNKHGSKVMDQGRWQCCHNTHKNFPIGLQVMYLYFPDTPRKMEQYTSYL